MIRLAAGVATGAAALGAVIASPAAALPRDVLVQYQDRLDAEMCPTPLGPDARLSFSGLFANDGNQVYATSIVILLVPATGYVTYNMVVGIDLGGVMEDAKVVRNDDDRFALAMDHQALRRLERLGGTTVSVRGLEGGEEVARFRVPADVRPTIAAAEKCAEAAQNAH